MKRFLASIYQYWLGFGHAIGVVVTPVQLFLVYLLIFGPARLFTALAGKDLLDRRGRPRGSFWRARGAPEHDLDQARHQF